MDAIDAIPFYFLRHGETDWNRQGLSQGRVDIPLNAAGEAQARAAASVFMGRGIRAVFTSTLGRAQQTARIVGDALGLHFTVDPDLQETSFGDQEGKPMGSWYDDWVAGDYTPQAGETFTDLRARVVPAINLALGHPGPVLVVAHGAMFRAVRAAMGLSALVRTGNGVALCCEPGDPWVLTPLSVPR